MNIIKIEAYQNGARPPLQEWGRAKAPVGYAIIPNTMDTSVFNDNNGFVNLTVENGIVTGMTANTEARDAWLATLPPEETEAEDIPNEL